MMKDKVKTKVAEKEGQEPKTRCGHYWDIEAANGPTSIGTCKFCGEKKEFYNAFPDFNPLRRSHNPMTLPELPDVKVDKESKS
jgi:hypothetical protein